MFRRSALLFVFALLAASAARADLIGYWPFEATSGTTARNAMPWGITGSLYNGSAVGNGPAWVSDGTRGQVLSFDGNDDWGHAGSIPSIPVNGDFTWSFWTYQQQGPNNDVALGNRFAGGPSQSFVKFTPRAFEYRPTIWTSNDLDYTDIPQNQWVHHAVVKTGPTLTYYRNGSVTATSTATGTVPALPFYIGGDRAGERWQGRIDDVAIWDHALSAGEVQQLATALPRRWTSPAASPNPSSSSSPTTSPPRRSTPPGGPCSSTDWNRPARGTRAPSPAEWPTRQPIPANSPSPAPPAASTGRG